MVDITFENLIEIAGAISKNVSSIFLVYWLKL